MFHQNRVPTNVLFGCFKHHPLLINYNIDLIGSESKRLESIGGALQTRMNMQTLSWYSSRFVAYQAWHLTDHVQLVFHLLLSLNF